MTAIDDRNAIIPGGTGLTVGTPTGGPQGPGIVNAQGFEVNGVPVSGSLAVPNAPLIGGNGTALSAVDLGAGLVGSGSPYTLSVTFGTTSGTVAQGNDSRIVGALQTSGGTMTGTLALAANPTSALQAAPKQYVDTQVATALPLTGGTLSGALTVSSGNIVAVGGYIQAQGTNRIVAGSASNSQITLQPGASTSAVAQISTNGTAGIELTAPMVFASAPYTFGSGTIGGYLSAPVVGGTAMTSAILSNVNMTGTTTSGAAGLSGINFNLYDTVNATAAGAPVAFNIIHNIEAGATASASRTSFAATANQIGAPTDATNVYGGITALSATTRINYQNPNATSWQATANHYFGSNIIAAIYSGVNYVEQLGGLEIDVGVASGASVHRRSALSLVSYDVNQAVSTDAALWIYGASTNSFKTGISFGDSQGLGVLSTGTFISAPSNSYENLLSGYVAKWGLDFQNVTFPSTGNPYDGGFLRGNGFVVDGAGTINQGSAYHTASSSGLAIDCKGSIGASATLAAAGSGYLASVTGYFTAYGGIWSVAINGSGVPTGAVTQVVAPVYPSTTPPSNPITPTPLQADQVLSGGSGFEINITWNTTATTLALNPSGGVVSHGGPVSRQAMASSTPSSGGTIAIAAGVSDYRILGPATLATLTVELPPSPANGQTVRVSSQVAITALTVKDGSGGTSDVQTPPTALGAGGAFSAQWNTAASTWWCCIGA